MAKPVANNGTNAEDDADTATSEAAENTRQDLSQRLEKAEATGALLHLLYAESARLKNRKWWNSIPLLQTVKSALGFRRG